MNPQTWFGTKLFMKFQENGDYFTVHKADLTIASQKQS
jgi:phospholipase C